MAAAEAALTPEQERKRTSTMLWVAGIALVGLIFDGYDLVVYGAVLPDLIADPSQLNVQLTKESAGVLGSYAMIGVMIGALATGAIVDMIGRRKVMLISYAWFSIGMLITALQASYWGFAVWRTFTGIGVGALVACTGAIVSEFAPPGKKNTVTAIVYAGVPIGSLLAALLAMWLKDEPSDWRMLFMLGALPLVTLLPLAFIKMPESIAWLASRGKMEQAQKLSEKTGVPVPAAAVAPTGDTPAKEEGPAGFAGLFSGHYFLSTVLIGLLSAACLLLVYALNTFLPLIMQSKGTAVNPLAFLLVLNGGAVIGALTGSRLADKFGAKFAVTIYLAIGAVGILLMTVFNGAGMLLIIIAVVGLGTSGTQTLIYALGATFYRTNVRGAGVSWTAGFGRIGGIIGPIIGGILTAKYGPEMVKDAVSGKQVPVVGTGNLDMVFYILAGIAVFGLLCTILLRKGDGETTQVATIQPSRKATDLNK